jgi:hypothetical protein
MSTTSEILLVLIVLWMFIMISYRNIKSNKLNTIKIDIISKSIINNLGELIFTISIIDLDIVKREYLKQFPEYNNNTNSVDDMDLTEEIKDNINNLINTRVKYINDKQSCIIILRDITDKTNKTYYLLEVCRDISGDIDGLQICKVDTNKKKGNVSHLSITIEDIDRLGKDIARFEYNDLFNISRIINEVVYDRIKENNFIEISYFFADRNLLEKGAKYELFKDNMLWKSVRKVVLTSDNQYVYD